MIAQPHSIFALFCKQLLMETKVGLAPGVAFGAGGEGNVRICYASDRPILEEAMARLKLFSNPAADSAISSSPFLHLSLRLARPARPYP